MRRREHESSWDRDDSRISYVNPRELDGDDRYLDGDRKVYRQTSSGHLSDIPRFDDYGDEGEA